MKRHLSIISFLVLAAIILNVPMFVRFTISDGKTGRIVYMDSIKNAREFVVSFRHSVNKTPVNEFIKIKGKGFVVYKTTFYSYGAGMPEPDPNSNQKLSITNGLVQIENIDRELDNFTYIVGTYADHSLSYNDISFKLSSIIKPQNPAFFSIARVSPFELIIYNFKRI